MTNLVQVQKLLGHRLGLDIFMLSITLEPDKDTPAILKEYAQNYGTKPGWLFLTGSSDDIQKLRRSMGVYDLDTTLDADKTRHGSVLTFGNERTGRWAALPALPEFIQPRDLVAGILRVTHEWGVPPPATELRSARLPTMPIRESRDRLDGGVAHKQIAQEGQTVASP